jgi:hypothetical protein
MRLGRILITSLLFLICGCVTHEYVPLEKNTNVALPYDVSVGDTVKLITKQPNSFEFEITEISEDALIGENVEVAFADIWKLQKKEVDKAGSAVTSIGMGSLGALMVLTVLLAVTF